MHKLYELKEKLMKELEDYADNGKFSKDDVEAINKKKDELNEVAMSLATKVYEQVAKENANETDDSSEVKDSNIKDAEYEEK